MPVSPVPMKWLTVFVFSLVALVASVAQEKRDDYPMLTTDEVAQAIKLCKEFLADDLRYPDTYREVSSQVFPIKHNGGFAIGVIHAFRAKKKKDEQEKNAYAFVIAGGRVVRGMDPFDLEKNPKGLDFMAMLVDELGNVPAEKVHRVRAKKMLGGEEIK